MLLKELKLHWLDNSILKLGGNQMARIDFDKQIEIFLRKNRHIRARLKEEHVKGQNGILVEVLCDRLDGFAIPDGMKIEVQNNCYYLISNDTGEFLPIIEGKEQMDFFRKRQF